MCAWCAQKELFHGNQKYCCNQCSKSAMAWAYPQKEDALGFLLERQNWKCAGCQYDYKPVLQAVIDRDVHFTHGKGYASFGDLPWHYFKRLKNRVPKEYRPEVDHIIPIYKGGASLGLDNHQAICYSCHKTKTAQDLSGKRLTKT